MGPVNEARLLHIRYIIQQLVASAAIIVKWALQLLLLSRTITTFFKGIVLFKKKF